MSGHCNLEMNHTGASLIMVNRDKQALMSCHQAGSICPVGIKTKQHYIQDLVFMIMTEFSTTLCGDMKQKLQLLVIPTSRLCGDAHLMPTKRIRKLY